MAYSSTNQCEQTKGTTRKGLERFPSYSEHFRSGCVKTLTTDLSEFVAEFKDCLCHEDSPYCPLSKEKHRLLGRILHLFQEDACILPCSTDTRSQARLNSADSSMFGESNRLTDQSPSESPESGYRNQSPVDCLGTCSLGDEPNFVIKKGYLLIINNVWFHGRCSPRNGTTAEGERMQNLFESFGFRVEIVFNCTTEGIRQILKDKATDMSMENYDCFALLMLSHGTEDGIVGVDNKEISYREIVDMVKPDNFPAMVGKPKLIFSQAGRGAIPDTGHLLGRGGSRVCRDNTDDDALHETAVRVPTDSNILMVYATTPGRLAYKHTDCKPKSDSVPHSWFLDALCQVFQGHAEREDLLSMLTRVNNHVAMIGDEDIGKQIPLQVSTLTRKVILTKRRTENGP